MQQPSREQLIAQLLETMNLAKRSMFGRMRSFMQDCPVPAAQLELLGTIAHLQPISAKQLAATMQLSPGAISQLVDGLAQQGLIHREPQPDDRRIHFLSLSTTGSKLLDRLSKPRQLFMEQLMRQLSDEELIVWLRIQEKMIAQFQTMPTNQATKGETI